MNIRKSLWLVILAIPLIVAAESEAVSSIKVSAKIPRLEWVKLAKLSATEAIRLALVDVPGVVVALKLEVDDGSLIYKVKVVGDDRRIIELELDAGIGAILEREEDD
jgi:uncharacterized membrane protein YkoI